MQMPAEPPRLPLPDPVIARKALSDVRNAMRAGFGLVREAVDRAPLPTPVAAVAGTVLARVDHLAHQADAAASTVVHGFLTAAGIATDDRSGRRAAAITATLRAVLVDLGATDLRVSDTAVREALAGRDAVAGGPPTVDAAARAAALMQRLLDAGAVRPASARTPAADPARAIFAAVLADLQAQGTDPAGIAAAAALGDALGAEIAAAGSDRAALARLFAEFRDHV